MKTRSLGPGAAVVSAVGFGGMWLSIAGRPEDPATGTRVIHAALERGVTLIDTADVYCLDDTDIGHNERLIASALRSWSGDRDAVVVATKGGMIRPGGRWERDARPAQLHAACERSLRALGVEQIGLYQLHAPDPAVPLAESVGALSDLQRQGKIRWIGLSNVTVEELDLAQGIAPIVTVQNRLNPFFREALETGVVSACAERGIGFLAYSPVGGGRLNRKLPMHPVLAPIARQRGVSAHVVTLAWVGQQGPTVIPIPSARTVPHVQDSCTAPDLVLSPEERQAIDQAAFSRA